MEAEEGDPLTPAGRFFLQPEMDQVINCVVGLKNPIDVEELKAVINNSIMLQHPRFCSVLARDKQGKEYWRRTQVELERHVFLRDAGGDTATDCEDDNEEIVNGYLADLAVSSPLATDKPLWEFHVLPGQKCCVLRIHHALGDGISLMSLFLASCRRIDDPDQLPNISPPSSSRKEQSNSTGWRRLLWRLVMVAWFTLVFAADFVLRSLWVKDEKSPISGGSGVELWPRKLATAKFRIDDMKTVKKAIVDATINDVLFGVISSGLSRYLNLRSSSSKKPQEGLQITGVAMVNIRKQPGLQVFDQDLSKMMKNKSGSRWGNQIGIVILPVYYHTDDDPLQYVKRAKAMLDWKKLSLEAHFSYRLGAFVMSFLGPKLATLLNYRIVCNTSFTVSNIFGPQEEIMVAGNPITYIRANSSSLAHAITMHMVSYAGRADLQILVAKDIIPDPKFLAKCFEDALLEMKDAAAASASATSTRI